MKYLIFLFVVLLSPLTSEEQPIFVKLETDQNLAPLYLLPFNVKQGFDTTYANQLEQIFRFDLSNNGSTELLTNNRAKERQAGNQLDDPATTSRWSSLGPSYVVNVDIEDKKISAKVLNTNSRQLTAIAPLPLSGDLNQDRRQIHRLSDAVHRALFNCDGIASKKMLYTQRQFINGNWKSEIWEADYDGANARRVLGDESGYCISPIYVPSKEKFQSAAFLYVSYKNGQPKIQISPLKGGPAVRLTSLRGNQLMPAISNQRNQIAFISDITGNPDLFVIPFSCDKGAIGKPRQIFTAKQATQGSPTFSPDGKQIAFVSNKDGSPRIYMITIPSEGQKLADVKARLITKANRESSAPSWSPDGSKLAYCAKNSGERQIWIYDFETDEEWQLTEGKGDKENPSWAPNSNHILYNSTGKVGADIYLINLTQKQPIKINLVGAEKHFPSWERG